MGVVCVKDKGSQPKKVTVDVAGVPAQGLVNTGASWAMNFSRKLHLWRASPKSSLKQLINPIYL